TSAKISLEVLHGVKGVPLPGLLTVVIGRFGFRLNFPDMCPIVCDFHSAAMNETALDVSDRLCLVSCMVNISIAFSDKRMSGRQHEVEVRLLGVVSLVTEDCREVVAKGK
ncbi:hypothetical protein BX616_005193, partial [Lobosporangium transversale]